MAKCTASSPVPQFSSRIELPGGNAASALRHTAWRMSDARQTEVNVSSYVPAMASNANRLLIFAIAETFMPPGNCSKEIALARVFRQIDAELNGDIVNVFHKAQQARAHRCSPLHVLIESGTLKTTTPNRMVAAEVHLDHNPMT